MERIADQHGSFSGETLESIADGPSGWSDEVKQLTPGSLGYRVEWSNLPGLTVGLFRYGAALRMRSRRVDEGLVFNAVLSADRPPRFRASEIGPDQLHICRCGMDLDYSTGENTCVLVLVVESDIVTELEWGELPSLFRTSASSLQSLARRCRTTLDRSRGRRIQSSGEALRIRDALLDSLSCTLRHSSNGPQGGGVDHYRQTGSYALVRRAEEYTSAGRQEEYPATSDLARALNVSDSTLHRAFVTWAGVSPGRYFAIQRLHAFRQSLLESRSGTASPVTRAATEAGINHLGRLAGDYRKLFGENPSQTLRRMRQV